MYLWEALKPWIIQFLLIMIEGLFFFLKDVFKKKFLYRSQYYLIFLKTPSPNVNFNGDFSDYVGVSS